MAYIGRNPAIGTQKVLDSLESQFNGTLTTFNLRYNSNTIYPPIASALIVSLGGVLQEPGVAYTVTSDTITFATAPPTGADCWILLYTEFGAMAGGSANFTVSNNLTIGNELHGPANFVIDPATIGDDTGNVEIKGNLTVQGTTTTINSTTVDLDHLSLGDSEVANFGDGDDLQIYHDGSHSYIDDSGTGNLYLRSGTLSIQNLAGSKTSAVFNSGGGQELYHNNAKKFETTTTGATLTGILVADGVDVGDSERIRLGDAQDLQIYHDGSNSFIADNGTGDLYIRGSNIVHLQSEGGEDGVKVISDGAVELYHDNAKKFETTSTGITVTGTAVADGLSLGDDDVANFGTDNDIQIVHESTGNKSVIKRTTTGDLYIQGASGSWIHIEALPGESSIKAAANGTVELYYDNSKKLETTNTGVTVTGTIVADALSLGDDEIANFGDGNDLQIYHNGTTAQSIIEESGGGSLLIQGTNLLLRSSAGENYFQGTADGSVELYYNNSKKLETTNTGITVTGALEVSAATNLTVGGTALPSLTGLLGGSLDGTLGAVTMAYLPSAPSSPVQGQFYFNSLNQKAQIYTGSSFVDLVPSGGGGGGGAGTTDAQATFRKYTYTLTSTTNAISGSSDTVVTAGDFVVGNVYTIKTIGTTDFTAIGASANTVGVEFTATGAGTGTGDAFDTLYYATGGIQNIEVYVNGVKSVEGSSNDYVATTGTSVNFTSNLASGDVVDIQVYELLTNDAYVLATGGTFTGNVGINTSTINNRLHIHSNANDQGILLTQAGSNYNGLIADANRTAADNYILNIEANWNGNKVARIAMESGNDTTNKDDGRIKFYTSSSGSSPQTRMHIAPSGNVAIGLPENTEASARLEVRGTGNSIPTGIHRYSYAGSNSNSGIRVIGIESAIDIVGEDNGQHGSSLLLRNENEGFGFYSRPDTDSFHLHSFTSSANDFSIHNGGNNLSAIVDLMSFLKGGNVGIGSTQPAVRLDVAGSAKFVNPSPGNTHVLMQDGGSATPLKTATTLRVVNDGNSAAYSTVEFESGSGKFVMLNNGHIGIGTDAPSRILHVGTTDTSAQVLVTGTTPQFRLSDLAADGTDANRAIFGLATAAGHFFSTAVAGDGALRSPEDKSLLFGIGVTERARLDDTGFKVAWNSSSAEGQVPLMLGVTAIAGLNDGAGAACTGVLRIKDNGGTDNRYHGLELRNRNSGDVRIFNKDVGVTNQADLVFGVDKDSTDQIIEVMRLKGSNSYVGIGTASPASKLDIFEHTSSGTDVGTTMLRLTNHVGADASGGDIIGVDGQRTFIDFRFQDANVNFTPQVRIGAQVGLPSGTDSGIPNEGSGSFVVYTAEGSGSEGAGSLTEKFRVTPDGDVGIGTDNPVQKLDVDGSLAINKRSGTDPTRLIMQNSASNLASTARIEFWESNHATAAATDSNAAIEYDGGTTYGGDGAILIKGHTGTADQVLAGFSRGGATHFTGNVGIGTTNPTISLDVRGSARCVNTSLTGLRIARDTSDTSYLALGTESNNLVRLTAGSGTTQNVELAIRTANAGAENEQVRIDNLGNVGVGTNNPEAKVHVRAAANSQFIFETITTANAAQGGPVISLGESTSEVGVSGGIAFVENLTASGNNSDVTMGLYYNGISNYFAITGSSGSESNVGANLRNASHHFVVQRDAGNIGIGTASPISKLDIYGGTDSIWLHKTSNGGGVGIAFSDHAGSNPAYDQKGYFRFYHSDGESFGHNAAFAFTSTETSGSNGFTVYSEDDFTAVGTLTQNYSDERLKTIHGRIDNPLEKLSKIHGYYYTQNETADELGFKERGQRQVGVSAQEIQEVLPEVIRVAPVSYTKKAKEEYYTVQYERVIPLLIESIKAQQELIEKLQQRLDDAGL